MVYFSETKKTLADGTKVTYLAMAHNTRKKGVSVKEWTIPLGKKEDALAKLKIIAQTHKSLTPDSAEPLSSALIKVYLDLFQELGLVSIIDGITEKNRTQGLTPGQYILFCVLNRLTSPTSTKHLEEWFEGTILKEQYPDALPFLTPQHIWNHFKYFTESNLKEIFTQIIQTVLKTRTDTLKTFLLDSTNFFTYIADHPQNTLPRKGHNKAGRDNLNQVNFCLLLDEEKEFPVYYKTYAGNIPDSQYFKEILPELSEWFQSINPHNVAPEITIVFDKGNNSLDALKIIEHNHWGYIGSLRPSMFKDLLHEPYTEFSKIYDTQKKHAVYAFRRLIKVYTDDPVVVIVTFDEQVHNKSLHTLEHHLAKKFDELQEFTISQLNTKPQWQDPVKIQKHIDTQILKTKEFKELIQILIEGTERSAVEYQELRWGLNNSQYSEIVKPFGKSIIFSNHTDWSTKEIVLGYRQQFKIEKKFAEMKSTEYIKVSPMRHWTDHNIRVHIFICLLALLGQGLLKLKLQSLQISDSFLDVIHTLETVQKVNLFYGTDGNRYPILPKLTAKQKALVAKFQLESFLTS